MMLKPGVRLKRATPQVAIAMGTVESVFRAYPVSPGEPTCTSVNDSSHKSGSLHYMGLAFDVRLPSRTLAAACGFGWGQKIEAIDKHISVQLREQLSEFDVLLEDHQKSPWDWHIHIEYDPQEPTDAE